MIVCQNVLEYISAKWVKRVDKLIFDNFDFMGWAKKALINKADIYGPF